MAEISSGASVLSSPEDTTEILRGIERLHTDIDLVEKLESLGLEVSKAFTWSRCAQETMALYKKLV
jgi:alpha-1,3-rhamnosyl/mannosyltransferase